MALGRRNQICGNADRKKGEACTVGLPQMESRKKEADGDMPYILGGCSRRKDPLCKYIDGDSSIWKPDTYWIGESDR